MRDTRQAARLSLGKSPRILICRLSAIGDCIHTMPLVHALRNEYPGAYLCWLVQPGGASLVRLLPELDEVLTVTRSQLQSPWQLSVIRRTLQDRQFDLAVDPQGLSKSALPAWLSGAPRRIGFARGQAREVAPWLYTDRVAARSSHVVDKCLELLGPLGISQPQVRFGLRLDDQAGSQIERFLQQAQLDQYAVLNPGAGWDSKLWPASSYAEVACHLWQRHRLASLVVWSGRRERDWAEQIRGMAVSQLGSERPGAGRGSTAGPVILAPDTSLPELAALLARATLFVGSDTGPLHLAAAVGTACVGMYGPTLPAHCGPYGDQHVALQAYYQAGSSRERRGSDNRAMRAITPQQTAAACDQLLERGQSPSSRERVA